MSAEAYDDFTLRRSPENLSRDGATILDITAKLTGAPKEITIDLPELRLLPNTYTEAPEVGTELPILPEVEEQPIVGPKADPPITYQPAPLPYISKGDRFNSNAALKAALLKSGSPAELHTVFKNRNLQP